MLKFMTASSELGAWQLPSPISQAWCVDWLSNWETLTRLLGGGNGQQPGILWWALIKVEILKLGPASFRGTAWWRGDAAGLDREVTWFPALPASLLFPEM